MQKTSTDDDGRMIMDRLEERLREAEANMAALTGRVKWLEGELRGVAEWLANEHDGEDEAPIEATWRAR